MPRLGLRNIDFGVWDVGFGMKVQGSAGSNPEPTKREP